jgi:c-di-GMP-binding flagellar brake protein YcgR
VRSTVDFQRQDGKISDAVSTDGLVRNTTLPAAEGPSRHERRKESREEVDTSAEILLVNVGSILRGRIHDLSLGGCRIRTEVYFPVGIYTRVEVEFRIEGLPFRLGGVIQDIHDRKTVGIRFLDLSVRKRQQILDLIGEIAESHSAKTSKDAG